MTTGKRIAVFMDFDDTLSTGNVAQMLLKHFAPEEFARCSARYRAGEITFREYQELSFDAVRAPVSELQKAAADRAQIRAGMTALIDAVSAIGDPVTVLSAGLDIYIQPVLQQHGLSNLDVICGSARRDRSDSGPFRYDYPFGSMQDSGCKGDWATCKCKALEQAGSNTKTVFVGDGSTSDACAAEKADHVFARDRLLRICNEKRVPATPFEDFTPVTEFINSLAVSTKA